MVDVPEGSIPEYGITIVSYIDKQGEAYFQFATHGESSKGSMVGLLHMAAHYVMHADEED